MPVFSYLLPTLRKLAAGGQPKEPSERKWRLDFEPGSPFRAGESPLIKLSVRDATTYHMGKKRATIPSHANHPSPAASPTTITRPRSTAEKMGNPGLSRARVFARITRQFLGADRRLNIPVLRICTGPARTRGASAPDTTEALQDREMLTLAVDLRLYQGEEGWRKDALEISALRRRITRARARSSRRLYHRPVLA